MSRTSSRTEKSLHPLIERRTIHTLWCVIRLPSSGLFWVLPSVASVNEFVSKSLGFAKNLDARLSCKMNQFHKRQHHQPSCLTKLEKKSYHKSSSEALQSTDWCCLEVRRVAAGAASVTLFQAHGQLTYNNNLNLDSSYKLSNTPASSSGGGAAFLASASSSILLAALL